MATLHPLLERQIRRSGSTNLANPPLPDAWQAFLELVSQTYTQSDQDRYLLERSMSISGQEMQTEIAERKKAEEALQKAHEQLSSQNQRLERVNELFRSMIHQLMLAVERGANKDELLVTLRMLDVEFSHIEDQS